STIYSINESGDTYGSGLDAASPELEPDLISAYATNGSIGYVYSEDLWRAQQPYQPKNPEEATKLMDDRFSSFSFVFIDSVQKQTGLNASIDVDAANKALRTVIEAHGGEAPFDYLTVEEQNLLAQLIPLDDNTIEIAASAYAAACAANDKSIPVYESDGTTVIGEFIVS
ncbi:MAG: hypothetical protein LBS98_00155, partial [Coriobacteriales bacterium]|nr:hypothetical protein [Coriobacteriales bacterium]